MDKYTKSILTIIAFGIILLNIQLFNEGSLISKAEATSHKPMPVVICNYTGIDCAYVSSSNGLEVNVK